MIITDLPPHIVKKGNYYLNLKTNLYVEPKELPKLCGQYWKTKNKTSRKRYIYPGLLCQDLDQKEIASRMGISVRTIDGYRDYFLSFFGCRSRVGIAVHAIKNKLVKI